MRDLMTAAVQNVYKDLANFGRPDRSRTSTRISEASEYPILQGLNVVSAQLGSMSIGIVNTIPNQQFEPVSVLVENHECPICFDDLMTADSKRCRKCKQMFHESCIKTWLQTGKASCPLCRYCPTNVFDEVPIMLRMPYFPMPSATQPPLPYDVLRRLRSL